jgi:hypothetical protein
VEVKVREIGAIAIPEEIRIAPIDVAIVTKVNARGIHGYREHGTVKQVVPNLSDGRYVPRGVFERD